MTLHTHNPTIYIYIYIYVGNEVGNAFQQWRLRYEQAPFTRVVESSDEELQNHFIYRFKLSDFFLLNIPNTEIRGKRFDS